MSDAPWPQGLYCWVMLGHAFSRWHAFTHGHGIRMAWNAVDDRGAGPWEQTWEAGPARKAGVWGPGSRQHGGAGCQVCWGETVTGLGWPSDPPGSSFLRVLDAPCVSSQDASSCPCSLAPDLILSFYHRAQPLAFPLLLSLRLVRMVRFMFFLKDSQQQLFQMINCVSILTRVLIHHRASFWVLVPQGTVWHLLCGPAWVPPPASRLRLFRSCLRCFPAPTSAGASRPFSPGSQ